MNFSRRLFYLLGLFFTVTFVARTVHVYRPAWDRYISFGHAVITVAIGFLTLKEFIRPSAATLAFREAERQLREQERQIEEERRLRRNARRREQRAAQRAAPAKKATTKAPPPQPPAKRVTEPVKSRWDRLLEDDEE